MLKSLFIILPLLTGTNTSAAKICSPDKSVGISSIIEMGERSVEASLKFRADRGLPKFSNTRIIELKKFLLAGRVLDLTKLGYCIVSH